MTAKKDSHHVHDEPREGDWRAARALLLNGSSGVGKSSALQALGAALGERSVSHALVDLDELALFWPRPRDDPWGGRAARANLAAVSSTYWAAGVKHIAVAHVFTDREHLDGCRAALSQGVGALDAEAAPLVRLRASRTTVEERLRRRHAVATPWELERFLAGYESLTQALDEAALDDVVVNVDDLTPRDVAERIADVAGW
ncbi:hypothetical protein M1E17_05125 [Arthrobacter sp. D1-29]